MMTSIFELQKREAQEQEKPGAGSLGTPPPSSSPEDSKEKRKASLLTVEVNENLIRRLLPLTQAYLDRKTKEQKTSEAYSNFLKEGRGGGGFMQFLQAHIPYFKRMHGRRRANQSHKLVTALRRMATMEDEEVPPSQSRMQSSSPLRGFKRFLDRARGRRDSPGIDRLKVQGEEFDFPRKASIKPGSHPLEPYFVMPSSVDKEDEESEDIHNVPSHVSFLASFRPSGSHFCRNSGRYSQFSNRKCNNESLRRFTTMTYSTERLGAAFPSLPSPSGQPLYGCRRPPSNPSSLKIYLKWG